MAALRRGPCRLLAGRALCTVNLCPGLKQAESSCKEKKIPPESAGEEGVEERVGAGVDRVEEDQQELGV